MLLKKLPHPHLIPRALKPMGKAMVSPWDDPELCLIVIGIGVNSLRMLNRDLRIGIPVNDQQGGVEIPNNVGWCRITDSYAKEESGIELGQGDKGPFREARQEEKLPGNESLQCGIGTIGHNGFHIRVPR
jgi:hypothetical protein